MGWRSPFVIKTQSTHPPCSLCLRGFQYPSISFPLGSDSDLLNPKQWKFITSLCEGSVYFWVLLDSESKRTTIKTYLGLFTYKYLIRLLTPAPSQWIIRKKSGMKKNIYYNKEKKCRAHKSAAWFNDQLGIKGSGTS